jgi:hypothetical protein
VPELSARKTVSRYWRRAASSKVNLVRTQGGAALHVRSKAFRGEAGGPHSLVPCGSRVEETQIARCIGRKSFPTRNARRFPPNYQKAD